MLLKVPLDSLCLSSSAGREASLKLSCIDSEAPYGKLNLSFASSYLLEINSMLEISMCAIYFSSSSQPVSSLVLIFGPTHMPSFELLIIFYMSIARYSLAYILICRNDIRNNNICLKFISYLHFILYHISESQILKFHKLIPFFVIQI